MVEISKRSHKRKVDATNVSRGVSPEVLRAGKCATCKSRNRDRREARRNAAQDRQVSWDNLNLKQKIKALDDRLGVGVGARKQRFRLAERLEQLADAA